jgi:SAM-dependent methyltransferase
VIRRVLRRVRSAGPYYRDPERYWNNRHREFGGDVLRGVGAIGVTEEGNADDYATKWQMLQARLAARRQDGARTLLDAGTGTGYFATRAVDLGYTVDAFDFSKVVIDRNRASTDNIRSWHVSPVASFCSDESYDVVMCIDVLFHIVSDGEWRSSVRNLANLTAPSGALIIQDMLVAVSAAEDLTGRTHTRWRTLDVYKDTLDGWEVAGHDRYRVSGENADKDLMTYVRTAPS